MSNATTRSRKTPRRLRNALPSTKRVAVPDEEGAAAAAAAAAAVGGDVAAAAVSSVGGTVPAALPRARRMEETEVANHYRQHQNQNQNQGKSIMATTTVKTATKTPSSKVAPSWPSETAAAKEEKREQSPLTPSLPKPKRPMTAYNYFFREERRKILEMGLANYRQHSDDDRKKASEGVDVNVGNRVVGTTIVMCDSNQSRVASQNTCTSDKNHADTFMQHDEENDLHSPPTFQHRYVWRSVEPNGESNIPAESSSVGTSIGTASSKIGTTTTFPNQAATTATSNWSDGLSSEGSAPHAMGAKQPLLGHRNSDSSRSKDEDGTVIDSCTICKHDAKDARSSTTETSASDGRKRKRRTPHHKVSFEDMGRAIANRWKNVPTNRLAACKKLAERDKERYRREMNKYYRSLFSATYQRLPALTDEKASGTLSGMSSDNDDDDGDSTKRRKVGTASGSGTCSSSCFAPDSGPSRGKAKSGSSAMGKKMQEEAEEAIKVARENKFQASNICKSSARPLLSPPPARTEVLGLSSTHEQQQQKQYQQLWSHAQQQGKQGAERMMAFSSPALCNLPSAGSLQQQATMGVARALFTSPVQELSAAVQQLQRSYQDASMLACDSGNLMLERIQALTGASAAEIVSPTQSFSANELLMCLGNVADLLPNSEVLAPVQQHQQHGHQQMNFNTSNPLQYLPSSVGMARQQQQLPVYTGDSTVTDNNHHVSENRGDANLASVIMQLSALAAHGAPSPEQLSAISLSDGGSVLENALLLACAPSQNQAAFRPSGAITTQAHSVSAAGDQLVPLLALYPDDPPLCNLYILMAAVAAAAATTSDHSFSPANNNNNS